MKIFALVAAGLLGMAATAPAAAVAAPAPVAAAPVQERVIVRERTTVRHDDRRGFRGPRWGSRRVCTNQWRHHRKVRVCRTVRYRR